jgi:hypothetical protein
MLVLLCVQVVQINNNESNWKKKKTTFFYCKQAKDIWACQESRKKLIKKNLIDKIHKELKLSVDHHIEINKNHNFLQV